MKKLTTGALLALAMPIFFLNALHAATITAVASGNWSDPTTWDSNPAVPGSGDDVIITGFTVTATATANCRSRAPMSTSPPR